MKIRALNACIPTGGRFVVDCRLACMGLVGSAAISDEATRLENKVDGENGHAVCALLSRVTTL